MYQSSVLLAGAVIIRIRLMYMLFHIRKETTVFLYLNVCPNKTGEILDITFYNLSIDVGVDMNILL